MEAFQNAVTIRRPPVEVCVGGEVFFLPFILLVVGRWSPRKAREDTEEHDRLLQRELASLEQS